jgi:hypothetical protein
MPTGVSAPIANSMLALMLNGTVWAGYNIIFAQLHTGPPGPNGTLSVAAESTRVSCGAAPAFAVPANGQSLNNNLILWSNVIAAETFSFVSLWNAATAGVFIVSGSITAQAINPGNNFSIPTGGLAISIPLAS